MAKMMVGISLAANLVALVMRTENIGCSDVNVMGEKIPHEVGPVGLGIYLTSVAVWLILGAVARLDCVARPQF